MTAITNPAGSNAQIRRGLSRRALIVGYVVNAVLCALFALLLVHLSGMPIGHMLVYSEAIGMSIMTLVVLYFVTMTRYGVRPEGLGFLLRIIGAGLLTIPGYMIGSIVAHALLGMPLFPVILPIPGMQDESIVGGLVARRSPPCSQCVSLHLPAQCRTVGSTRARPAGAAKRRCARRPIRASRCCARRSIHTCCSTRWPRCARWYAPTHPPRSRCSIV
ncbi:MAG: hypothetical protein R3E68_11035 [Burkholderiaceae bacterium]